MFTVLLLFSVKSERENDGGKCGGRGGCRLVHGDGKVKLLREKEVSEQWWERTEYVNRGGLVDGRDMVVRGGCFVG